MKSRRRTGPRLRKGLAADLAARNVTTAPVAKFHAGDRVVADFLKGGPISGIAKKDCRVPGLVTGIRGRFLRSPEFAEWTYTVRLDRPFCSEEVWSLTEGHLSLEPTP